MSDPTASDRPLPGWAPGAGTDETPSGSSSVPGEDPGDLASYDASPDVEDDDVIDISDNAGPELTTGVADWAPGAGSDGARSDLAAVPGDDTGSAGGHGTAARGDDSGTETPPRSIPDDEP